MVMKRLLLMAALLAAGACVLDNREAPPFTGPSVLQVPNGAPLAAFTFSPSVAVKGEAIEFDGTSSTDDGSIVDFVWTFGDGGVALGPRISRSFNEAGNFSVTLRVTDDRGLTGAASTVITVREAALVASFTFSPTDPAAGAPVNFNGLTSSTLPGATITDFIWDFGDGSFGSGATASHTYASAQTFTIVLTVRDSTGRQASTAKTLQVK